VWVGTDSHARDGHVTFATAIVIYKVGNGATYFYYVTHERRSYDMYNLLEIVIYFLRGGIMNLNPNDVIKKLIEAEENYDKKLKDFQKKLIEEQEEQISLLEKEKEDKMLEVDNQYKAIIKKAEERSRDLLDEADRDIKNYKNKFEKLEKDKEKIAKKVIEKN